MKRILNFILSIIIVLSFFCSCNSEKETETEQPEISKEEQLFNEHKEFQEKLLAWLDGRETPFFSENKDGILFIIQHGLGGLHEKSFELRCYIFYDDGAFTQNIMNFTFPSYYSKKNDENNEVKIGFLQIYYPNSNESSSITRSAHFIPKDFDGTYDSLRIYTSSNDFDYLPEKMLNEEMVRSIKYIIERFDYFYPNGLKMKDIGFDKTKWE